MSGRRVGTFVNGPIALDMCSFRFMTCTGTGTGKVDEDSSGWATDGEGRCELPGQTDENELDDATALGSEMPVG